MIKYTLFIIAAIILLTTGSSLNLFAQAPDASVKINGEVTNPFDLKLSEIQQFKQVEVKRADKDGKNHSYTGPSIYDILQKAGATLGKDLRGKNLTKYVLINASDGYQVVFALAELDPEFADRQIILATTIDDEPLGPHDGPFRVIVQNEKKPARCIRQVTSIKVQLTK